MAGVLPREALLQISMYISLLTANTGQPVVKPLNFVGRSRRRVRPEMVLSRLELTIFG